MEWGSLLLLLICPLMMIFMMRGHGGHGHHHDHHSSNGSKDLEAKLTKLEQENEKLRHEINALSSMVKKES